MQTVQQAPGKLNMYFSSSLSPNLPLSPLRWGRGETQAVGEGEEGEMSHDGVWGGDWAGVYVSNTLPI